MFRRRPKPPCDPLLEGEDFVLILRMLAEIRENTRSILEILEHDDGEEEADEP